MEKMKQKCPNKKCGSEHIVRHGKVVTQSGKNQRYKCQDCGTTFYDENERNGGSK